MERFRYAAITSISTTCKVNTTKQLLTMLRSTQPPKCHHHQLILIVFLLILLELILILIVFVFVLLADTISITNPEPLRVPVDSQWLLFLLIRLEIDIKLNSGM